MRFSDLNDTLQAIFQKLVENDLPSDAQISWPEFRDINDVNPGDTLVALPQVAFPAYDVSALSSLYGVNTDGDHDVLLLDLQRDGLISHATEACSAAFSSLLNAIQSMSVRYVALLNPEHYELSGVEFLDDCYLPEDDNGENAIGHMMCPSCGHRDHFSIEVIGADPEDVDIMESQSRIQARMARGELAIVSFMADFYPDGSEDTVSSIEWKDDGRVICPGCHHEGTMTTFSSLHDVHDETD